MSLGLATDRVSSRTATKVVAVVQTAASGTERITGMAFMANPEPGHGIPIRKLVDHIDICTPLRFVCCEAYSFGREGAGWGCWARCNGEGRCASWGEGWRVAAHGLKIDTEG